MIKNEENAYHTKTSTTFDFTNAREIQEILGFNKAVVSYDSSDIVSSESISTNPANITRGLNVIQLYSSITNSDSDGASLGVQKIQRLFSLLFISKYSIYFFMSILSYTKNEPS